ncbi:MAG TPA: hypothetical protein VF855_05025 [Acidimicrobiales bacterium]
MHALATVLAFGWAPEIRGLTFVGIAVIVLCGSIYMLLGTNLGARLGFLVVLAGFFGWMTIMGSIWWAYGIGLKGDEPSWVALEVIKGGDLTTSSHDVAQVPDLTDATQTDDVDGWLLLAEDDPGRGQAVAAAEDVVLNRAKTFKSGEFIAQGVWDKGGDRGPMFTVPAWFGLSIGEICTKDAAGTETCKQDRWDFDYIAFWHQPHHVIVELQPVVKVVAEPGKAPPTPTADESQPPQYVLMVRDAGAKRHPSALIALGSGMIFGLCCWALHRRDRLSAANRSAALVPATAGS